MFRTPLSIAIVAIVAATAACTHDATGPLAPTASVAQSDPVNGSTGSTGSYYGQASTARIRLIATLNPPANGTFRRASGKASWDSRNNNTKRELEMEVQDVPAGTQVEFFVAGSKVGGPVTVDALGTARISLSTQLGQQVPTAAAGLSAEVRTTGGVVVVTGVFPAS